MDKLLDENRDFLAPLRIRGDGKKDTINTARSTGANVRAFTGKRVVMARIIAQLHSGKEGLHRGRLWLGEHDHAEEAADVVLLASFH